MYVYVYMYIFTRIFTHIYTNISIIPGTYSYIFVRSMCLYIVLCTTIHSTIYNNIIHGTMYNNHFNQITKSSTISPTSMGENVFFFPPNAAAAISFSSSSCACVFVCVCVCVCVFV